MSVEYDITADNLVAQGFRVLHAGDDYDYTFTIKRNSVVLALTSSTLWFTAKESAAESDAEAKLQLISTSSSEIEITDATGGTCVVKFRGTGGAQKNTSDLSGKWEYDLQVKLAAPASTIITLAFGDIEFLSNLTRSTS